MTDPAGSGTSGSKWQNLVSVMTGSSGIVAQLASRAKASDPVRIGLVTFADDDSGGCGTAQGGKLWLPPTKTTDSSDPVGTINNDLNSISPNGGTPTAAAMQVAAGAFAAVSETDRPNFIVLLTDGAPNCNSAWSGDPSTCYDDGTGSGAHGCVSATCCFVPNSSGQYVAQPNGCSPQGCLDESNLVATIGAVNTQAHVQTFVIGFGRDVADANSLAFRTLDESATAGGKPQSGEPKFYLATDQDQLNDALNAILAIISANCQYTLDATPPSANAVEVIVTPDGQGGQTLTSSQYTVTGNTVTITDSALCQQITEATSSAPVAVTFNFLAQ
jgi:hypothetical protein